MNHVWLVGSFEGTDAADVPAWAIDAFAGATFRHFRSPQIAARHFNDPADVVLVVQHRPREFASSGITALVASQPLAHVLVGLGAWCASSARGESLWPESIAVPLWELPSSLRRIAFALEQGEPPDPWQTSGRDEVLLGEREWIGGTRGRLNGQEGEAPAEPHQRRAAESTLAAQQELRPPANLSSLEWSHPAGTAGATIDVAVESPDRVLAESLREIVKEFVTIEQTPTASPLMLWDADPLQRRLPGLAELRRRRATDHIIALVDQPTRSIVDRLRRAGADAVISKPFRAAELWLTMDRLASTPENDSDDRDD